MSSEFWSIEVCECGAQMTSECGYDGELVYCPADPSKESWRRNTPGHQTTREVEVVAVSTSKGEVHG